MNLNKFKDMPVLMDKRFKKLSLYSENKDVKLHRSKVEESAKKTEEKSIKTMKAYLGENPNRSDIQICV